MQRRLIVGIIHQHNCRHDCRQEVDQQDQKYWAEEQHHVILTFQDFCLSVCYTQKLALCQYECQHQINELSGFHFDQ